MSGFNLCQTIAMSFSRLSILSIVLLAMMATFVLSQKMSKDERDRLESVSPKAIQGVWQQVGDGRYLEIEPGKANFYHYTPVICYIDSAASGKPLAESYALYRLSENGQTLKLWMWDFGDRCEQQYFESFVRVQALPNGTVSNLHDDQRFDDPQFLLRLIISHFDQHYPHFRRRVFDWEERKQDALWHVKPETPPEELFEAVRSMLHGLGDSHTRFSSRQTKQFFKSGQARLLDYLDKQFALQDSIDHVGTFRGSWHRIQHAAITPFLRDTTIQRAINGRFRWGILKGNIGYVENDLSDGF